MIKDVVCVCERERCIKELAHMIKENEKFQGLVGELKTQESKYIVLV